MIWDILKLNNIYNYLETGERVSDEEDFYVDVEDGEYEVLYNESLYWLTGNINIIGPDIGYLERGVFVKDKKFIKTLTIEAIRKVTRKSGYHGDFIEKITLINKQPSSEGLKGIFEVFIGS